MSSGPKYVPIHMRRKPKTSNRKKYENRIDRRYEKRSRENDVIIKKEVLKLDNLEEFPVLSKAITPVINQDFLDRVPKEKESSRRKWEHLKLQEKLRIQKEQDSISQSQNKKG